MQFKKINININNDLKTKINIKEINKMIDNTVEDVIKLVTTKYPKSHDMSLFYHNTNPHFRSCEGLYEQLHGKDE